MGQIEQRYPSVKPYLPHALATTCAVIFVPFLLVTELLAFLDPDPPMLVTAIIGVATSIAITTLGAALWARRRDTVIITFSELMVWRWWQRRRAEQALEEGARLLGLDRSGQPVESIRITPEQQLKVLHELTAALESKDPYTHGHSQRVERHSYRTAAAMGLTVAQLEDVRKAAALHDVGKIRVPERVLRKPTGLTIEERAMMEEHAVVGAWMVSSVGSADVIEGVRHHHERWDGLGYPDGLRGESIPLFARVIAVADAYDAITSTRPYRAGAGRDHAVEVLRAETGTQFDPTVVEAFVAGLPTRIPVAAGLLLALAGPNTLWRRGSAWFRRLGTGTLAPAVGAASAAVVIGASAFAPTLPARQAPTLATEAAEVVGSSSVAGTFPSTQEFAASHGKKDKKEREDRAVVVAAPAPTVSDQVLGKRIHMDVEQSEYAAQPEPTDIDDKKMTPEEPPEPTTEPDREPTPDDKANEDPPRDPHPDKGRDCEDHPGNPDSQGNAKHCG